MKKKILTLIAAFMLLLGVVTVLSPNASAGTGSTWCLTAFHTHCINAWNGGPYVKLYVGSGNGGANSDFTLIVGGSLGNNVILRYTGNSGWADGQHCIGDAVNDPGRADSSLDVCNLSTGEFGWGTLFTAVTDGCPFNYVAFHNNHWGGYLGPGSDTNGSPMYLNKGSKYCFLEGNPA